MTIVYKNLRTKRPATTEGPTALDEIGPALGR